MFHTSIRSDSIHRAEVLGAFSYALDLTEGQPAGHSIRSCWIGMQIGERIGLARDALADLYYTILLKDLGCSSNAARICELYDADDRAFKRGYKTAGTSLAATLHFVFSRTARNKGLRQRAGAIGNILRHGPNIAQELIVARCTRGADIARILRFPDTVADGIYHLDEHWDGSGRPDRLSGCAVPLYSRIALLAQIAEVFHAHAGPHASIDEVKRRARSWLDPDLVSAFVEIASTEGFWTEVNSPLLETRLLAIAPSGDEIVADDEYLDSIARAFGEVIDAKSPFTSGHSRRVADLATRIGEGFALEPARLRLLRRAAFLHDVGKLGVSSTILEKPAGLNDDEWVEMRNHAEMTRTILGRINALHRIADIAAAHHERLDGAGYPRRMQSQEITLETRIITCCDFFDALTADRPYRRAMPQAEALEIMRENVGGAIDPDCFAVLETLILNITNESEATRTARS